MKVNFIYLIAIALIGCERAPTTTGMKEWSPSDHDQPESQQTPPLPPGANPHAGQGPNPHGSASGRSMDDIAMLTSLIWKQQCANCHGGAGLGDGPAAVATKPPNLTDPAWQKATTNEQIAQTIKNGKGKMPKFDVPDAVVKALILHIRSLDKSAPR